MKKVLTILILTIVSLGLILSLFGCEPYDPEKDVEKVDGYYVYKSEQGEKKEYSLMGVDSDKIINGVLTIPEKIGEIPVTELGIQRYPIGLETDAIPMYENDEIRKIIINHDDLIIYLSSLSNLRNLKEIEINGDVHVDPNALKLNSLLSISSINRSSFYSLYEIADTSKLHSIRLEPKHCTSYSGLYHPENVVALFLSNYDELSVSFASYNSLSVLIIPETVTHIDEDSFKNSNIDVYVRLDEETFKKNLDNGWDNGVNVEWGFKDEIVIFDTMGGTEIKTESTQKNYLTTKIGEKITPPTPPTREGYTFLGWYKDYVQLELWDFENDLVQESMVLVAGWQEN